MPTTNGIRKKPPKNTATPTNPPLPVLHFAFITEFFKPDPTDMAQFLFLLFAIFTVLCAVGVVVNKNAVNASICLILCLVGVAGLFVQLDAYL